MKKLSSVWKKYINRVSVLITVFSVLMTASFYNPASLAAGSDISSFPWRLESLSLNNAWVEWDPRILDFGDYKDGATACGIFSSSGTYKSTYSGISSTGNSGKDYHLGGTLNNGIMNSYHFSLPFFLWPLQDREPGTVFTVNGKMNLYIKARLDADLSGNAVFCSPPSFEGLRPDGLNISYFITSGAFTLNPDRTTTSMISVQIVFDNVELGLNRDHLSFQITFDGACFGGFADSVNIAPNIAYSFTVNDANLTLRSGYAQGSDRDIVDGYNASSGNASQSKLDTSLSVQEAKEDSLFASASDNLSKFSLTDLSAIPKVVAGLAFVSSTMTSIFESLGGVNGAGIVLSVGCSILFVSFCIGAYKFYSGRKD